MRIGILLGCVTFIALLLVLQSEDSPAGIACETDLDGVPCHLDNCLFIDNGPFGGPCSAQEDGDLDGYGNSCDSDFNNNGATDPVDLGTMITAATAVSTALVTDLNCNGAADPVDLGTTLLNTIAVRVPGPSGLACAGTAPCP